MGYLPYSLEVKVISWILAIIVNGTLAIYFFFRRLKTQRELKPMRDFYRMFLVIYFSLAIARIFFLASDFERDANDRTLLYNQFVLIAYVFMTIAIFSIIYHMEKYILIKTKFIITIFLLFVIILIIIMLFNPTLYDLIRLIYHPGIYLSVGVALLLYLNMTIKTREKARLSALFSFIGLATMMVAGIFELDQLLSTGAIPPYITPIFFTLGMIIFTFAQASVPEILIQYYSSKKICLVHKGKIKEKIIFCTSCYVNYCEKCYNSVIKLENNCWACGKEISKPKYERKDQLLDYEEEVLDEPEPVIDHKMPRENEIDRKKSLNNKI